MPNGGKRINDLKIYFCGGCLNNFHRVFRNVPNKKQMIPAVAAMFRHNGEYYLFDTGYARRVFSYGWMSKIYHTLNPVIVNENEELVFQLAQNGIHTADIKGIILSHLHPDHIGGLKDFPESTIYLSKESYSIFQKPT